MCVHLFENTDVLLSAPHGGSFLEVTFQDRRNRNALRVPDGLSLGAEAILGPYSLAVEGAADLTYSGIRVLAVDRQDGLFRVHRIRYPSVLIGA